MFGRAFWNIIQHMNEDLTELMSQPTIWKQEADNLLEMSGILPIFRKYGEVNIHGSYALDLMLSSSDIDIYVINPVVNKEDAYSALSEILETKFWNDYRLYDFVETPKDRFPSGRYIWLEATVNGHHWDLSILFVKEFPPEQKRHFEWLLANLDDDKRRAILEIKNARDLKGWDIDSIVICNAVVKDGIASVNEFEKAHVASS